MVILNYQVMVGLEVDLTTFDLFEFINGGSACAHPTPAWLLLGSVVSKSKDGIPTEIKECLSC